MDNSYLEKLLLEYSPYLAFAKKEKCFPINVDLYIPLCEIRDHNNPDFVIKDATQENLFSLYPSHPNKDYYLNFTDPEWKLKLRGNPLDVTTYAKILPQSDGSFQFIYFYIYSHVEPYHLFGIYPPLNKYAHQGDIKFVTVFVNNDYSLRGVYFGAHGRMGGQWRDKKDIRFDGTHPIAYPSQGDHSNYSESGLHPRIYGLVFDICQHSIYCKPNLVRVYDINDSNFNVSKMGFLYFPGDMSVDGVDAPARQWFFNGNIPINDSNNWFRRLCCYKYF